MADAEAVCPRVIVVSGGTNVVSDVEYATPGARYSPGSLYASEAYTVLAQPTSATASSKSVFMIGLHGPRAKAL